MSSWNILLTVWGAATYKERAQLVKMLFEPVYVDTKAKQIVAYRPSDQYRALSTLCQRLREEAGLVCTLMVQECRLRT